MPCPTPNIDAKQFADVADKTCKRWSERSLGVAKALIVDKVPLFKAAAAHKMSHQQANMIRTRFIAKIDKMRVEEFMQRETPKLANLAIERFSTEIQTLRDKGYEIEQIVVFLKENNVITTPAKVRDFLRNLKA